VGTGSHFLVDYRVGESNFGPGGDSGEFLSQCLDIFNGLAPQDMFGAGRCRPRAI
jgi:hypothetical protein